MSLNNIKKLQSQRGFTLVELLIVIVIIAILAAITIVAYNGITNRAHTSAAQQAAQNVVNKAEAYNAEIGHYPIATTDLTGAATTTSYNLPTSAVTFSSGAITAAPSPDSTVQFVTCPASATATTVTGVQIKYWKFDGTAGIQTMTAGTC